MLKPSLLLCAAILAFGADDPWAKVKEIKSGVELRVYKKGAAQPLLVKMDEATDDNLAVVNKNEQIAIPKDQIDRIDFRPSKSRVTKETKSTVSDPSTDPRSAIPGPDRGHPGPASSTSTSVNIGSKPDFETIYRRPATAPKK
jgi:hypothetical protein